MTDENMSSTSNNSVVLKDIDAVGGSNATSVLCVIRDLTNTDVCNKFTINLGGSLQISDLCYEVANKLGYVQDTFLLQYEKELENGTETIVLQELKDISLSSLCAGSPSRKHSFDVVEKKAGSPPIKMKENGDLQNSQATTFQPLSNIYSPKTNLSASSSIYYSPQNESRASCGYVGLVNQAMTCYLNSLLQTLFMTPEFRNAIYSWEFKDHRNATRCVPYQLQKLFLMLQTCDKRAVETTGVTTSFGWSKNDAFLQQDIQELCRVLFEALEERFAGTSQNGLIKQLYEGEMKDIIHCLECNTEKARTDTFMDIPLDILPFGHSKANSTLEEALQSFVSIDKLCGGNQYSCGTCKRKTDANKRLQFTKFPYLLTLQLKRFTYGADYQHYVKLHDKLTFPEILNLNGFIAKDYSDNSDATNGNIDDNVHEDAMNNSSCEKEQGEEDSQLSDNGNANGEDSTADQETAGDSSDERKEEGERSMMDVDVDSPASDVHNGSSDGVNNGGEKEENHKTEADQNDNNIMSEQQQHSDHHTDSLPHPPTFDEEAANSKNAAEKKVQGPYEYELFSIMIHSGSASGGHYYAYIKSFPDGQWYSFNDSNVSSINHEDICKSYGGASSYSSSSTCAYMLMYRQIDRSRNKNFFERQDFPDHLLEELKRIENEELEEKRQLEIERNTCKLKVFCFHPVHKKQIECPLSIHKDVTLRETTEQAWKELKLDNNVPLDCVRLVKYDEFDDWIERSYDGEDDARMEQIVGRVSQTCSFDMMMELRNEKESFIQYHSTDLTIKVYNVDLKSETISPPRVLRCRAENSVGDLRVQIQQLLGVSCASNIRLALEQRFDCILLLEDAMPLNATGFQKTNKVYSECSGAEPGIAFKDTRLYTMLDRFQNTIRLTVKLPPLKMSELDAFSDSPTPPRTSARSTSPNLSCARKLLMTPSSSAGSSPIADGQQTDGQQLPSSSTSVQVASADTSDSTTVSADTSTPMYVDSPASLDNCTAAVSPSSSPSEAHGLTKKSVRFSSGRDMDIPVLEQWEDWSMYTESAEDNASHGAIVSSTTSAPHSGASSGGEATATAACSATSEDSASNAADGAGDCTDRTEGNVASSSPAVFSELMVTEESTSLMHTADFSTAVHAPLSIGEAIISTTPAVIPTTQQDANFSSLPEADQHMRSPGEATSIPHQEEAQCVPEMMVPGSPPPPPPPPLPPSTPTTTCKQSPATSSAQSPGAQTTGAQLDAVVDEFDAEPTFRASVSVDTETTTKELEVYVDKRVKLGSFKLELEPYVGVSSTAFKVYQDSQHSLQNETEMTDLHRDLSFLTDDSTLKIKLGRALKTGEERFKVYELLPDDSAKHSKYLFEMIIKLTASVYDVKAMLVEEMKRNYDCDTVPECVRIRKKTSKNPGAIFLNEEIFADRFVNAASRAFFVELLEEPDMFTSYSDVQVYVHWWRPSLFKLENVFEIIVENKSLPDMLSKISAKTGIPTKKISYAKGYGSFPCRSSVLKLSELSWVCDREEQKINVWPLNIFNDGEVLFVRDVDEEEVQLNEEQIQSIKSKENLSPTYSSYVASPPKRKERALKIYAVDKTPPDQSTSTSSEHSIIGCAPPPYTASESSPYKSTNSATNSQPEAAADNTATSITGRTQPNLSKSNISDGII